ncbi:MAG: ABC transporter ATP-binding protein [Bacteroidota bacterium]
MITLSGISKAYDGVQALRPTSLTVGAGHTTVLIGPSGCGKSTLLRLIVGLIWPDTGTVEVDGTRLTPETARAVRQRTGYVIQQGGLFPHLTAAANVGLLARHLGWSAQRIAARTEELAELVHLAPASLARYPAQLSGGQQQRVGLMRALMLDPPVLLLDEPLGALDPMIRAELQGDLRAIFDALHKTVVLVTHDLAEAGFFGDTVVLLRDGAIVQQGPFADLLQAPASPFVEAFVQAQRHPLAPTSAEPPR